MDINLLAINLGSSRLAMGVFRSGSLDFAQRVSNDEKESWPQSIVDAWERIAGQLGAAVIGASVNPPLEPFLEEAVRQHADRKVQWIGKEIDLPILVRTDSPEQTGVDRVVNIAAAYEQMRKACVVVDAGTAITIDCCDDTGAFLGGAIAPGVSVMLNALHENTATLPKVGFQVPTEVVGRSTESAMRSGIYHGVRGMVKEIVEGYATELGQWPEIIATGGDAQALFEGWDLIHAISPDLTFYGIALAYTEHHIKHGT